MFEKTKICFFSGVIARSGGTERVGSIVANELCQRGYDVYLLSCWNHGAPHYKLNEKIHVHYLLSPLSEGKLYRTYIYPIWKLHNFLKTNNINILIDIDTELSVYSARAICGTKCKLISWEHFNYWTMCRLGERRRIKAKHLIKKYASRLVVLTEEDRQKHLEMYGMLSEQICTINNPCISNVNHDYNYEHKVFLAVGRLALEKGYDWLVQAWSLVESEIKDWQLIIVGTGSLEKELKQQCNELKLQSIYFAGHSNQVESFYKKASCFVLSSRYEGFPMVILEAQSYALPVIAFDCKTGPRELITDSRNGYLIESGNIVELAKKMIQFTQNSGTAKKMSSEARKSVSSYNLEVTMDKWVSLINEIIENDNT